MVPPQVANDNVYVIISVWDPQVGWRLLIVQHTPVAASTQKVGMAAMAHEVSQMVGARYDSRPDLGLLGAIYRPPPMALGRAATLRGHEEGQPDRRSRLPRHQRPRRHPVILSAWASSGWEVEGKLHWAT